MLEDKFKLPASSYEELAKIVMGYSHSIEPQGLDDVGKLTGLNTTIISANAGFLVGIGILEPGAKKVATQIGRKLGQALEHGIEDEIRMMWGQIASGSEFITRLLSAIRIRNGMDQQTLEAHIAYSAGQPKKPQYMTGSRTVIDILKAACFIKETDGKFVVDQAREGAIDTPIDYRSQSTMFADRVKDSLPIVSSPGSLQVPKYEPVVSIKININCSASEIAGLGPQIRRLVKELRESSQENEDTAQRGE